MPKPGVPANPFDQHSFSVPRNMLICAHPNCQLVVSESAMLCPLHDAPHRDHGDDENP